MVDLCGYISMLLECQGVYFLNFNEIYVYHSEESLAVLRSVICNVDFIELELMREMK